MGFQKGSEAARAAGRKRAEAFTAESQRAAALAQSTEIKRRAGKRGWEATCKVLERKGVPPKRFLAERVQEYREAHLTSLELRIIEVLRRAGLERGSDYRTNELVWIVPDQQYYLVDFRLGDCVLEVDGDYWHAQRCQYDRQRDDELRAMGLQVTRIAEAEMDDELALQARVEDWVRGASVALAEPTTLPF